MNSNFKLITRRAHYLKRAPSPSEPGPILLDSTPEYHWDSLKEDLLKSKRKQAKNLYNEEVKCSNFLNIAFLPLVQETYLTEKKLNNREIKLNRFAEGELLSQEELKFLADTSSLLNRCVDRKFLQDSINIISPDILENLELVLSENIIMNYENLRNTIKKARLDYLKEVNEIKHSKIHEKTEDIARNEAKQRRIKENQKFRKTLDNICWKMERQGCFSPKNKPNSQALAKIFIKKLKRSSLSKKNSLTEIEAPKLNPEDYSKESQKKLQIKRRKYHPSSKLFLQEHNSNEEEDLSNFEQLKSKSNLKEVSKFNLTIHTTSLYKNPFQFRNFYSGGPNPITTCSESFLEHNDKKKPFIGTPNEIKNAILIQKHTRRYLAQLKLRSMREDNPPNHILERIQYNIRDNKTGNRFFNSIQSCKNLLAGSKNKDSKPGFFIPEVINNTKKLKNQLISSSKGHSKPKNTTMFTSISTRNFSTQNSITSQDFLRKNPQESFQATGGLLKHRKLIEYTKNGTFQAMKNLGFSFTKGDANCKDELGNSPLFYASERGLLDFCDFLLRLGANPNERCSERNTPVHMAFKSGKMELVSLMMKHGGDLRLKNKEGNSPRKLGTGRVMKEFDLKIMVSFG